MAATGNLTTEVRHGHTLTFRENPYHVYKLDDRKIPGSTDVKKGYPPSRQLIRYYIKQGLEEFDSHKQLTKQADVGTAMHDYCHARRLNQPFDKNVFIGHPDAEKIFKRFGEVDKWLPTVADDKVIAAEEIIAWVCPLHRNADEKIPQTSAYCTCFGGKFDCLIERDGLFILQDYKSAKGHFADQFIQAGGYDIALEYWRGIKVSGYEVIRFNDNTENTAATVKANILKLATL